MKTTSTVSLQRSLHGFLTKEPAHIAMLYLQNQSQSGKASAIFGFKTPNIPQNGLIFMTTIYMLGCVILPIKLTVLAFAKFEINYIIPDCVRLKIAPTAFCWTLGCCDLERASKGTTPLAAAIASRLVSEETRG